MTWPYDAYLSFLAKLQYVDLSWLYFSIYVCCLSKPHANFKCHKLPNYQKNPLTFEIKFVFVGEHDTLVYNFLYRMKNIENSCRMSNQVDLNKINKKE